MPSKPTPHKHAAWLIAIAEGHTLQSRNPCQPGNPIWRDVDSSDLLTYIAQGSFVGTYIRIKPDTITIGDVEVNAPLNYPPKEGEVFWYLCWCNENGVDSAQWNSHMLYHHTLLSNAAVWLDKDDALAAATAIHTLLKQG